MSLLPNFLSVGKQSVLISSSDLSNNMSALNLSYNSAALLQQQQQQEQHQQHQQLQQPQYGQSAHPNHPPTNMHNTRQNLPPQSGALLTAPQPTRGIPTNIPLAGPAPRMWTPDMGIKFGGGASNGFPQANPTPQVQHQHQQPPPPPAGRGPQQGQWDPSKGLQFR